MADKKEKDGKVLMHYNSKYRLRELELRAKRLYELLHEFVKDIEKEFYDGMKKGED